MGIKIDYQQIEVSTISSADTDDASFNEECYVIPVIVPLSEATSLLSAYNEADANSPSIEISRATARLILSALKAKMDEG